MAKEALSQDLADFLVTKNFDPEYFDEQGQPSEAGEAKTLKFDYVSQSGKNYGTAVIVIADDDLSFFFGDNLGRGMESEDKQEWYEFLEQLSDQAASHSVTWSPSDINRLKHTLAGIAAIKEGLFEGYYGTRKVSYMGEQTDARLVIKHNRTLGEADKRYRYVESLFIETADEQRFKLPFRSLAGGRAMLEHVRSGGKPYDVRGTHIAEIVSEMAVLSRFHRAQQHRIYEGVTQELVESAKEYYRNLQGTLKHLGSPRGYQQYFESWMPDSVGEAESLVEDLRNLFVEQSVDARIEAALPTLAKIQQQGTKMKEAEIFESWINQLSEGTWALPDTPEAQEKLNQLMSSELIVGPDATNATEQLYDVIGDDKLFDILSDLADRDPRANCWDDSDVQRRLAELGIQTPQSTAAEPSDVAQDEAPAVKEAQLDEVSDETLSSYVDKAVSDVADRSKAVGQSAGFQKGAQFATKAFTGADIAAGPGKSDSKIDQRKAGISKAITRMSSGRAGSSSGLGGVRPGQSPSLDNPIHNENTELARMLKHAGVPLQEAVLRDDTGNTWDHLLDRFRHEVEQFKDGGELDSDLYDALFDYYMQHGAMPYGVAKGRTGDPFNWVSDRLADDLGMNENLIAPQIMPVSEGSCNMTAEGAYCPEHGLAECGSMYEDGGAVGMPYSMGEGVYDPDYRGGYNNEFDELEDLLSKSGMSQDDLVRQRFLASKYGLNTPADMAKLPALKKDAETGYVARKAALDADLEKRNQQYMQDKLTDLEYQQDPVAFMKRRTQQITPTAPASAATASAPTPPSEPAQPATPPEPGVDYSLPPAKLGSSPSMKLPNFRPEPSADTGIPAQSDQLDTGKSSIFQQLAQLRNKTRGNMAENSNDDPINSNSAMTGSYYEGKETKSQEGDALLARIKSLAMLK